MNANTTCRLSPHATVVQLIARRFVEKATPKAITGASAANALMIAPTVEIHTPSGPGPFPAVVIMHNCAGLDGMGASTTYEWARFLIANGYAVLLPDSFRPRERFRGVCTLSSGFWVRHEIRGADAYAALEAARNDPRIDARRVAVMDGSNGGVATLAAVNSDMLAEGAWLKPGQSGFAAAIAFYPECGIDYGNWQVADLKPLRTSGSYRAASPLTILIGALDDWTPVPPCDAMVKAASGAAVTMKVYPGAHHSFDSAVPVQHNPRATNINNPGGGATVGRNPAAHEDSRKVVLEVLRTRLAP